jgi:hypothetical protein
MSYGDEELLSFDLFDDSEGEMDDNGSSSSNIMAARNVCDRCERPARVCWCPFVPDPPVEIR